MTLGIFLEKFTDTEIEKDPGLIASGLARDHVVTVFAHTSSPLAEQKFNLKRVSRTERDQASFWRNSGIQVLIIYSWLSLRYSKMIQAASQAGVKVILKLDSDGYLLFPVRPSYLRVFGLDKSLSAKLKHLIRLLEWSLFPRLISRRRIKQIETCAAAIIESPRAKENLLSSLDYWHQAGLGKKIKVIPNPIKFPALNLNAKRNRIVCIGRWDDARKNAGALVKVLSQLKTDWEINIIGHDALALGEKIKANNPDISLTTDEKLSHTEIFQRLASAKIFFAPSLAESFNLAAAEALVGGCSLVGGPLPSFQYFSDEGRSGNLASDFSVDALQTALENDLKKWTVNGYQAENIAAHWQAELNLNKISSDISQLINSL